MRWGDRRRGRAKSGGLRVIYYYFAEDMQIWFLTVYGKDDAADLSPRDRQLLRASIEEEKRLRARARSVRRK